MYVFHHHEGIYILKKSFNEALEIACIRLKLFQDSIKFNRSQKSLGAFI